MDIKEYQKKNADNEIVRLSHKKHLVNQVFIFTNFDQREALEQGDDYYSDVDTAYINGIYFN